MQVMRHWHEVYLVLILSYMCITVTKADFGQAIVNEAVDLFSAQLADDIGDDPRSMEDLLHWAISHSDPEKLAILAEEAQRIQLVRDLKEQRRRVQELLDHVRSQPTETDMMKEGLSILQRVGASDTELLAALQALQVLVEPVDNANDLHPLGGIAAVVAQLTRGSSQLTSAAAHVLGTASSNNPTFQRQLLAAHPDIVHTLLQVSQSLQTEEAVKGMYALAALVRNLQEARKAFADAGGFGVLEMLLRGQKVAARVKRKALSLFMDLMDTQPVGVGLGARDAIGVGPQIHSVHSNGVGAAPEQPAAVAGETAAAKAAKGGGGGEDDVLKIAAVSGGLPQAVVSLLLEQDPAIQEEALLVVQRLASSAAVRKVLRESGADDALSQLNLQLLDAAPGPGEEPDSYHEYLVELAREVGLLMALEESGDDNPGLHFQRQQGQDGAAVGTSKEGQGFQRGAESQHQVLALGGPTVKSGRLEKSREQPDGADGVVAGQCGSSGTTSGGTEMCDVGGPDLT